MERIKRLDEETINKIAAGEVIDRPGSVLKELVENSLDAGATTISVEIEDAGLSLIEVKDDGIGMDPEDLQRALLRHTTSKIQDVSDLFTIRSFGFRGEALASIAAVSKMEIASIPKGQSEGISIEANGGKTIGQKSVLGKSGTIVKVRDLFFNTPARKKFLKSRKVELSNLSSIFWDLAVPCTGVDFTLQNGGISIASVSAGLTIPERVRHRESDLGDIFHYFSEVSPYFLIDGLVSSPVRTFPRSNRISLFVNKRAVKDGIGVAAIKEGMRGFIPETRYPCAYLFIEVSPDDADFNVHPAKREVRFRYRKELFELIRYSLKKLFIKEKEGLGKAIDSQDKVDVWIPPEREERKWYPGDNVRGDFPKPETGSTSMSGNKVEEVQDKLFETPRSFSERKLVGQVLGNYALVEGGDELLFLDIHAASERINYWKVMEAYRDWLDSPEHLLITIDIPIERLKGQEECVQRVLSEIGYIVLVDGEIIKITAVPLYLKGIDPLTLVSDLLDLIENETVNVADESKKVLENIMARVACHISLRGTRPLPEEELRYLLEELDRAIYSQTCPHGRPVFITVTRRELHKLFGRT